MKKVFQIFGKDLKSIIKSPAAIGIIIGLCIIPSFYAWITLKANWNPYVDTGNVPVAVVNDDQGTIVNNSIVNFGDKTVTQLQSNDSIKWTFVGQKVADEGLKDGQYYAIIEIPNDFSKDLESGLTGNPIKPTLIYKVNEKTNAIATKITDLATGQLQQQIKQTFFDAVNKVVLTQANQFGEKITNNKPLILEVKNVISDTNQNVNNILNSINDSNTNVSELGSYISTLKNNLPELTAQINNLQNVVSSSKYLIQATQSNMKNIESSLNNINTSMGTANNTLQSSITSLKNDISSQEAANKAAIDSAKTATNSANNNINSGIDKAKDDATTAKDKINEAQPDIKKANDTTGKVLDGAQKINDVNGKILDTSKNIVDKLPASPLLSKEQIQKDKDALNKAINANNNLSGLISSAKSLLGTLEKLNANSNNIINSLIDSLNNLQAKVQDQNKQLNDLNSQLSNANNLTASTINSKLNSLGQVSSGINNLFGSFTNNYSTTINGSLTSLSSSLDNSLNNIDSVLAASKQMIPELNAIANMGISSSNLTTNKLDDLKGKLDGLKNTLNVLEGKTSNLTSQSLDNMVSLLSKNPQQLSQLLSSPVGINVQELYGMSVFGIGLAPFYTVLAIWVGALLCTTIIGVSNKKYENGTKKRILQIHFGRMLLFIGINFIQATIVTLGDIFILGIHPANFWLLMGFTWFSGVVFTVIIFTLVSLSGNFGKAGALVIMVIQVAGAGAIYPIEVNPVLFQKLEFLWPFTYAIDGFRQAIGGADWSYVYRDIIALCIFLAIFLLLGFTKVILNKQIEFVENSFKESEL